MDDNSGFAFLAAAGAAYGIYKLFSGSGTEEKEIPRVQPGRREVQYEYKSETPKMILAVDATPTSGGAFLRIESGGQRLLYYYYINWSGTYRFPNEPDKFEMANAILAMATFENTIIGWINRFAELELIIKIDNAFPSQNPQYRDAGDKRMFDRFRELVSTLSGNVQRVGKSQDRDMRNANQLSRKGAGQWVNMNIQGEYPGYSLESENDSAEYYLRQLYDTIPTKYVL